MDPVIPEVFVEGLTNKKGNIRKTVHEYKKAFPGSFKQVRKQIILEATWLGNFHPNTTKSISSYVSDMMVNNAQQHLVEKYNLNPFEVKALSKQRTFCEKIMSLVRFSNQEEPYRHLANKIRHIYDLHMMLKDEEIRNLINTEEFDQLLLKVGDDDFISYKNNNAWLENHPAQAIIFDQVQSTWNKIKASYHGAFSDLVIGTLPDEEEVVESLKSIGQRLKQIDWNIDQ